MANYRFGAGDRHALMFIHMGLIPFWNKGPPSRSRPRNNKSTELLAYKCCIDFFLCDIVCLPIHFK